MPNGPADGVVSVFALISFIVQAKWRLGRLLKPAGGLFSRMRIYPHTRLRALALKEGRINREDDLLEPVFYDPYPLRLLVGPIRGLVAALWRLRRLARIVFHRGHHD
jgi:hypothetical protein